MSGYLYDKFKGVYRVKADYDLTTNDFPRDISGIIDPSFDDYYIPSAKQLEVRHGYRNILSCFLWTPSTYSSVIRGIAEIEHIKSNIKNKEIISENLLNHDILTDYWIGESEGVIQFRAEQLTKYDDVLQLRKRGSNISPFSNKNLPKLSYKISHDDLQKYHKVVSTIPKEYMYKLSAWNRMFKTKYSITNAILRKNCLDLKQYIHKNNLWDKYIDYLTECVHAEF